jgi:hypothetical protein
MIVSRVKTYLAILGAFLAGLAAIYFKGRSDENEKHEFEDAKAYRETRKRIDEVSAFDGADAAREWLRDRQNK